MVYNKKINTSNIPIVEKDGYEFIGWKEQESEDNFDFEIKIKKNYKLYANYKKTDRNKNAGKVFEEYGFVTTEIADGISSLILKNVTVIPDDQLITINLENSESVTC